MCERVDTFTIVGPSNLDVNSVINDVSCSGGNDGNISLITNNNVSYVWSNGDTTSINMLSSGNYSCNIFRYFWMFRNTKFSN